MPINLLDTNFSSAINLDQAAGLTTNAQTLSNSLLQARASSSPADATYSLNNSNFQPASLNASPTEDNFVSYTQQQEVSSVPTPRLGWFKQLSTPENETSRLATTDSGGNIYFAGLTTGALGGSNAGGFDAWIAKYNTNGNQLFLRQFGTADDDVATSIATDSANNVYIAGYAGRSSFPFEAASGYAWLAKYDSNGNQLFRRQFGTPGNEVAYRVATDSNGNVYIAGGSIDFQNVLVAKYDSNGNLLFRKSLSSFADSVFPNYITVDSVGNFYMTGSGDLVGSNAATGNRWLAKYDSDGNQLFLKQFGSNSLESGYRVAVDNVGNVYITGETRGNLGGTSAGGFDAWVAKYDSNGNQLFLKQFGTNTDDGAINIAVDSTGNFYLTGYTGGTLGGTSAGGFDAWIAKYDSNGNQLFIQQFGRSGVDIGCAVTVDSAGNVYLTGVTFERTNVYNRDVWVAKYQFS